MWGLVTHMGNPTWLPIRATRPVAVSLCGGTKNKDCNKLVIRANRIGTACSCPCHFTKLIYELEHITLHSVAKSGVVEDYVAVQADDPHVLLERD